MRLGNTRSFMDEWYVKRITRNEYMTLANRTEFQYCARERASRRKSRGIPRQPNVPSGFAMLHRNFYAATNVALFGNFFAECIEILSSLQSFRHASDMGLQYIHAIVRYPRTMGRINSVCQFSISS